jgi:hypothetical protein
LHNLGEGLPVTRFGPGDQLPELGLFCILKGPFPFEEENEDCLAKQNGCKDYFCGREGIFFPPANIYRRIFENRPVFT